MNMSNVHVSEHSRGPSNTCKYEKNVRLRKLFALFYFLYTLRFANVMNACTSVGMLKHRFAVVCTIRTCYGAIRTCYDAIRTCSWFRSVEGDGRKCGNVARAAQMLPPLQIFPCPHPPHIFPLNSNTSQLSPSCFSMLTPTTTYS